MKTINTILVYLSFLTFSFGQWIPTSNLTVFSDDGSPFYLILNGEKYNENPQTNIRVEELPNPYYSCKIIFKESTKGTISKNIHLTDPDNVPQDVTYIIKAQTPSKYVLRYYSAIPAEQNMRRPTNANVYRFGTPNVVVAGPGFSQQTTHQVTTTTHTSTGNANPNGINVNIGGVGVNMNVNIPGQSTATTTTTTTTTMSDGYTSQTQYNSNNNYQHNHNQGCVYAMNTQDFNAAKNTISEISFSDTQLSTAKKIASSNCLSSDQIGAIMSMFSFDDDKLEFAKYAYDYCVDRNNYFKIINKFSFDDSKEELNEYILGRP